MTPLATRFRKTVLKQGLITLGERVVVAVSGGLDSCVLLDLLCQIDLSLFLVVAHLNHGLRGKESDLDAEFVQEVSRKRGLACVVQKLEQGALPESNRQEAARMARYDFLKSVARSQGCSKIVTAHHANDQLETLLLKLIRGSGPDALLGIRPLSIFSEKNLQPNPQRLLPPLWLARPLLLFSRDEILEYAESRSKLGMIAWREDSSNAETHYRRNQIRHEVIPPLIALNPKLPEKTSSMLLALQYEHDFLAQYSDRKFAEQARCFVQRVEFDLEFLKSEHLAIRYRLYRKALSVLGMDLARLSELHLESLDALVIQNQRSARLSLPQGFLAYLESGCLEIGVGEALGKQIQTGFFY